MTADADRMERLTSAMVTAMSSTDENNRERDQRIIDALAYGVSAEDYDICRKAAYAVMEYRETYE